MTTLIAGILRFDAAQPDAAQPDATLVEQMLGHMQPVAGHARVQTISDGPFTAGVIQIARGEAGHDAHPPLRNAAPTLVADIRLYDSASKPIDRLIQCLKQSGPDAAGHLHGDFAFASWDGAQLLLARDHFGVRPLQYVYRPSKYLAFASLPGALLQTGLATRKLDREALAPYAITVCAMGERTYFQDIKSVLPSYCISVSKDQPPKAHRYWRLPLGSLIRADTDRDEIADKLRALLKQAVQRRLPKHGPGAGHLSGGLDSGSITSLAAEILKDQDRAFHAYCLAEDRSDPTLKIDDEWPYAKAVADRHQNITLRAIGSSDLIPRLEALDADLLLSLHPLEPEEQILRDAVKHGASVLFSGWGGDEVVTWRGHSNVAELLWSGQWASLMRAIRRRAQTSNSSATAIFRKAVLSESLPGPLRDLIRNRRGSSAPEWLQHSLSMVAADKRESLGRVPDREYGADSRIQRRGWLEHWSLPSKLEPFAQHGARYGISYAFPMLDLDLLAYAVRIPAVLLKEGDQDRALFRRAMQPVLPDKVRLKTRKLAPYPAETLRQSIQKEHLIAELQRMSDNPLVREFIDTDGVIDYIAAIPDPQDIRAAMNAADGADDQAIQQRVYHIMVLYLAWYLDRHRASNT